jgi:hypothetical protein
MEAIWNANPLVSTLYCFEDGNCFINKGDAMSWMKATQKEYVIKQRPTEEVKEEVKTKKSNK